MGRIGKLLDDVVTGFKIGRAHVELCKLLSTDRDQACAMMSDLVEQSTPQQLDQFEQAFLFQSVHVVDTKLRLRAMELYVYLKMRETAHYGQFRGFIGACGPL